MFEKIKRFLVEEVEETEPDIELPPETPEVSIDCVPKAKKPELVLIEANTMEEAEKVGIALRNKQNVVLNLARLNKTDAQRVLDFLSGIIYLIDGKMMRIAEHTFVYAYDKSVMIGEIQHRK